MFKLISLSLRPRKINNFLLTLVLLYLISNVFDDFVSVFVIYKVYVDTQNITLLNFEN